MSKLVEWTAAALIAASPALADGYGLGRPALPDEIAAWDVDISPDGRGLPEGRGDVETGDRLFVEKCGSCHGDFAEGRDNWPALAGGFDTLDNRDPVKTVGSYWPYLSTLWDYVHRSMPFGAAQTLEDDEVYAIVAYILYSNSLVEEDFELSHETFMDVEMYNTDGFIVDDRPRTEYPLWRTEPCMEDCKESVKITMRATVLDVTPDVSTDNGTATEAAAEPAAESGDGATGQAALDPELVEAGEKVFRKCRACHEIGDGAGNKTGPHLNGIFGRTIGGVDGFRYSEGFEAAADEGRIWDEAEMAAFLASPRSYMKGTKMSFAGLRKDAELEAIAAYLKAAGE